MIQTHAPINSFPALGTAVLGQLLYRALQAFNQLDAQGWQLATAPEDLLHYSWADMMGAYMGAAAWYDWVKSPILTDKLTTQTSKLGIFVGQPLENIAWGPSFMIVLQSYPAF